MTDRIDLHQLEADILALRDICWDHSRPDAVTDRLGLAARQLRDAAGSIRKQMVLNPGGETGDE
jgi:hypothetical protein